MLPRRGERPLPAAARTSWRHIFGAGILGGIGFTMSIFITNLAFAGEPAALNSSKMAILLASLTAGNVRLPLAEAGDRTQGDGRAMTRSGQPGQSPMPNSRSMKA